MKKACESSAVVLVKFQYREQVAAIRAVDPQIWVLCAFLGT